MVCNLGNIKIFETAVPAAFPRRF